MTPCRRGGRNAPGSIARPRRRGYLAGVSRTPHNGNESPGGEPGFLHRSVAAHLRERILSGVLAAGAKLPTLREIAEEFDVSTMAVRQAIRLLDREGLIRHIAGVGAFVRSHPPAGKPEHRMLAFVAMDLSAAFDMAVARGVERACQKRGWSVQILDAHLDVELETRNMLRLPESGAQGAVVLPPWHPANVDALFRIHQAGFPLVLVDRTLAGLTADLVESDHEKGGHAAAGHLIARGHRRILMVSHEPNVSSIVGRIHGYERALREAGIRPDPGWMVWIDAATHHRGFAENRRWLGACTAIEPVLAALEPPVGVVAIDAYAAWGVYEACRRLELRVPEDVSVIGFDDSELAHAIRPPMTIVAQRTDDIGRAAVDLLERRVIESRQREWIGRSYAHVVIDIDLIERQSVADVSTGA